MNTLLVTLGVILLIASIFADQLNIGEAGFGVKQWAGVIIGLALVLVGLKCRKEIRPEVPGKAEGEKEEAAEEKGI